MRIHVHVALLSLCAAASLPAATYSAWGDFGSTNPSGAWKYGTVATDGAVGALDATFTPMPTYQANFTSGGGFHSDAWLLSLASSDGVVRPNGAFGFGTVTYSPDYLNLHPASDGAMAVVAFTAPTPDVYTFTGEWADHDVLGGTGVEIWTALGNGNVIAHGTMPAVSSPVAINFSQSLTAGQSVYFVLGYGGEYTFDSTGLKLDVTDSASAAPEPSSLLLVGLSAAAVWLKRRHYAR